jgi:hypothetical protein
VLATIAGAVAAVLARYAAAPAGQDSREPSPGSASAPRM